MVEAEVYVFVAAIALSMLGLTGGIAKRIYKKELRVFRYLIIAGVIGALLFPVAFIVSMTMGRLSEFVSTVFSAPLQLIGSIGTGKSYSDACVNGTCAIYCCESVTDPDVVWKDCDENCDSMENVAMGKQTGDTCQYSERQAYCKATGVGGTHTQSHSACNNLPELGPITCTCCTSSSQGKWWDCTTNCASNPTTPGFPVSASGCASIRQINCNKNTNTNSDTNYTPSNVQGV